MNAKQIAYQFDRKFTFPANVAILALAAKCGYDSIHDFANSDVFSGMIKGAVALYLGYKEAIYGLFKAETYFALEEINADKKSFPFEHSNSIIIDDSKGLEFLLSKTRNHDMIEWGTLLNSHDDNGRAIVDRILDISAAQETGILGEGTRDTLRFNHSKAEEAEYNGCHHYHPTTKKYFRWGAAMNYSIGMHDRFSPHNWINLLTFNMPDGPEIIGYNRQYVYIAKDFSKKELVRATPKQILAYLGT